MIQELANLKRYIEKLFTRKEKFSLVRLITSFEDVLIHYMPSPSVSKLLKPYYLEIEEILNRYKLDKESVKNPMRRKHLREQAAKKIFGVLERLGGVIPKWRSALPDGLEAKEFGNWKEQTLKTEYKFLAKLVSSSAQLQFLRNSLCDVGDVVANVACDKKLQRLVTKEIREADTTADSDVVIGDPTIKHGPKYN